jgi:hypothetical protein
VEGGGGKKFIIYWFNSESLNCCEGRGRGEVFNLLVSFQIFKYCGGRGEVFNLLA